jgi:hypothetical protein
MAILASCLATAPVHAQQGRVVSRTKPATPAKPAPRKPDLADTLSGSWAGDVISDSKGSSKSDVTLTIERTGPNMIRISSDYPRLPVITVPLERAMTMILNRGGNSTVFYDPTRSPPRLDVSFNNEVSWSGIKQ